MMRDARQGAWASLWVRCEYTAVQVARFRDMQVANPEERVPRKMVGTVGVRKDASATRTREQVMPADCLIP